LKMASRLVLAMGLFITLKIEHPMHGLSTLLMAVKS
jgi:hypothetical protein